MKETLLLALITIGLLNSPLSAADDPKLGVENIRYYPQYTTENSHYSGYAADIFNLFSLHTGTQFKIKPLPVKRLFLSFFEGEVDFKYPDSPYWGFSKERERSLVSYSEPVVSYIDGCMVLRENAGKGAKSIKVLGTVRGFTPFDYLDRINSGEIKLSENSSFSGLMRQVIRRRVDCGYVNIAVARYQLNTVLKKPGQLVFDPDLPHTRGEYTLSSIKYPEVIEDFNQFLTDKSLDVDRLKRKYGVLVE